MASCLVTGGTGFIGAEVVRRLADGGEDCVILDLAPSEERISGIDVDVVQGDLSDAMVIEQLVATYRPDVIYHFGGLLSMRSETDPVASFDSNAAGTLNVLEAARKHGTGKVIYASTMVTYGRDIEGQTINDSTLQRPNLFYGATKVFSEHMGLWYGRKYGIDFRGLRYPGIVGPGVRTPGVAQYNAWMIEAAIKGEPFTAWVREDTRHAILYYRDAAEAAIQLADASFENLRHKVYVVTSDKPSPTAGDLAAAIRRQIPDAQITFEVDQERQRILDSVERPIDDSAARSDWGFAPIYNLDEMVSDMRRDIKFPPDRLS